MKKKNIKIYRKEKFKLMELLKYPYKNINNIFRKINYILNDKEKEKLRDKLVEDIYINAENIAQDCVSIGKKSYDWGETIDNILTSKKWGFPIMLLMLGTVFWITIAGANYPSEILADGLFWIEEKLSQMFISFNSPDWLHGILIQGIYRTMAWVVSVMLPPMAIFFPLFTLLEDLGVLPRIAFNLDNLFKKAGAHGKQSLTMSMGFGCNAAGVIAARIIDSPREKLIAIITNNFVPCNGRFPILIILASIFLGSTFGNKYSSLLASTIVVGLILFGIVITILVSWGLSKTVLRGIPSSFTLELPPYRKPKISRVLIHSFIDRTLFVLGRAVIVAAPAGVVVWILANIGINGISLIDYIANFLDPFAVLIGLDGFILLSFILGLPANEIVIPILVMSYLSTGAMIEPDSASVLGNILLNNGWTWVTALATMLFSLLHFPCGTTLLTIRKETNSIKWTIFTFFLTTTIAILVNFIIIQTVQLFI